MRDYPAPHNTGRTPRDDQFFFADPLAAEVAPEVFHGLAPRPREIDSPSTGVGELAGRTLRNGIPLLMTGSLAVGVGVTSSIPVASPVPDTSSGSTKTHRPKNSIADLVAQVMAPAAHRVVTSVAPDLPATYRVSKGDTVTSVAEKFGIPTPLLLGLNGLSWNSILHEGQVLSLTGAPGKQRGAAPQQSAPGGYVVQPGETLSSIASRLGVSVASLAEANALSVYDLPPAGSRLVVPRMEEENAGGFAGKPTATIVLASFDDLEQDLEREVRASDDPSAESDGELATGDPLALTVEKAPELRILKKEPPRPTPTPVAKPVTTEKDDEDEDNDSREDDSSSTGKPVSGAVTPLNETRRNNAQVIVNVGRELGVPDYGIVIALATAMQESSLRNIDWGDRDSVGLFQQRPSSGWGSAEQLLDPAYAARAFYGGPGNPSPGRLRGLLDYSGWQSQSLTVAAQRVQRSAHPDAYAKWEASAWAWLDELS